MRSERATSSDRREVMRYDEQHSRRPTNSFFSLFFERPVRHRYFHQLNQSATNLVRRLSQSRLFLNSTRTENANYRNNYVRTNTQESTETRPQSTHLESDESDDAVTGSLVTGRSVSHPLIRATSMPLMSPEADGAAASFDPSAPPLEEMRSFLSETNIFFDRAETPPPPYIEVITEEETTT